jgi:hypothetical protein
MMASSIRGVFFMAIYTLAELDAEISAYKVGLHALATAEMYKIESSGSIRWLQRAKMAEYREHLLWLENQHLTLVGGPDAPCRRTYAKQGGRG